MAIIFRSDIHIIRIEEFVSSQNSGESYFTKLQKNSPLADLMGKLWKICPPAIHLKGLSLLKSVFSDSSTSVILNQVLSSRKLIRRWLRVDDFKPKMFSWNCVQLEMMQSVHNFSWQLGMKTDIKRNTRLQTEISEIVGDMSWKFMTCHDKTCGFVMKSTHISPNVTKCQEVKSPKMF